jgi:hypothetical protein
MRTEMHDVVALLEDMPEQRLIRGQVGVVVETWELGVYEVEFAVNEGWTYAMTAVKADQLIVLHHGPVHEAA